MGALRQIRTARLHRDQIAEYRRLHDNIPDLIVKHLIEAGYTDVQIYLHDDVLVMLTEFDSKETVPDRSVDDAAERDWHSKTGACFSSEWQVANKIFDIRDTLKQGQWGHERDPS